MFYMRVMSINIDWHFLYNNFLEVLHSGDYIFLKSTWFFFPDLYIACTHLTLCMPHLTTKMPRLSESDYTLPKKATIHQVTTMLSTSKNVLFPGHDHLLTTGTDDPSLAGARVIIKVSGHQYRCLAGGYDLEIEHF